MIVIDRRCETPIVIDSSALAAEYAAYGSFRETHSAWRPSPASLVYGGIVDASWMRLPGIEALRRPV
jgi:hypothetical protein